MKVSCATLLILVSRYLVATTTIWSGASYIYTKDAVKILSQDDGKKGESQKEKK